jgi:predicted  nucleic acid-binding Zn-ribbon protein
MISISDVPGGNPVARADPEHWSLAYGRCEKCGGIFCDRCLMENSGRCPQCGVSVQLEVPEGVELSPPSSPAEPVPIVSEPPAQLPVDQVVPPASAAPTEFAAREWQTLQFAPLWVFSLTAGIDNDIDEKEIGALSQELAEAGLYRNGLARMVLYSVGETLQATMAAYGADSRDPLGGLTEVADLLDRKLPSDEGEGFKRALLTIGLSVSRASGGEAGGDPVSAEEKMALMLVAGALRTQL